MIRTTMICIGPPDQGIPSRLFQLFDRQRLAPVNFISIRLEDAIWIKFQIEGSWASVVRLRARILSFSGVELYSEQQMASLRMRQGIVDGIRSLGFGTDVQYRAERRTQTSKGLQ